MMGFSPYPQVDSDANARWNKYQADQKAVLDNPSLSEQGKREQLARLKAGYDSDVEIMRANAKAKADSERKTAQLALSLEAEREIKKLRTDVGEVLAAAIIKERLEASTSAQIQAVYESVKDDAWGAAVVGNYGRAIISRRAGERPKAEDITALEAMKPKRHSSDVEYENRVKDLAPERIDRWLANLDRGAYQQDVANRFRVSAHNVPMPEAGD